MANFSLSLINNRGTTVLTDYDTIVGKTAGLTFDENLNLSVDGSTLSFSMLKYLYEGSHKVVNAPAIAITYGSIIQCVTNQQRYDFAITDISYQFLPDNLQLQFSAQDYFQFELSKIGVGYSVIADTTDPEYFGSQPIDAWARKIVQDNNLRWNYIDINQANQEWINLMLSQNDKTWLFNTNTEAEEYWEYTDGNEITLNQWVSFECSDSSAYNALKQLATDNDLTIVVDYTNQSFWFVPTKSPIFNGYYFNPNNNLQQFAINGSAQNLVTVLNITGPTDLNNQEITLVPTFPSTVSEWILTDEWLDTKYFDDLYTQYTDNRQFLREINYTPWLENKLIDISFFTENDLILPVEVHELNELLYNQLRIANGRLIVKQHQYLKQYEEDYMDINQEIIRTESLNAQLYGDIDTIYNDLLTSISTLACFGVKDGNGDVWINYPNGVDLYANNIQITAASIGGELHDLIASPEVSSQDCNTILSLTNVDLDSYTTPLIINSSMDSNKKYQFQLFKTDAQTLFYCGNYIAQKGWQLCDINESHSTVLYNTEIFLPRWTVACRLRSYHAYNGWIDIDFNITTPTTLVCSCNGESYILSQNGTTHCSFPNIQISLVNSGDPTAIYHLYISTPGSYEYQFYFKDINLPRELTWGNNELHVTPSIVNSRLRLQIERQNSSLNYNIGIDDDITSLDFNNYRQTVKVLPDSINGYTVVNLYKFGPVSSGEPIHIQVIGGPVDIYGKITNSNIFTNHIQVTEDLTGTYIFNSIYNACQYTGNDNNLNIINTNITTAQPDMLNQLCGIRNTYTDTLGINSSKFLDLWNTMCGNVPYSIIVLKYKNINIDDEHDIIHVNDHYNTLDNTSPVFTQTDINNFSTLLKKSIPATITRSELVPIITNIIVEFTDKWTLCYNSAMGLGIYWPKNWDCSDWLTKYWTLAKRQKTLLSKMLPLVPLNWLVNSMTPENIILNTNIFPIDTGTNQLTVSMLCPDVDNTYSTTYNDFIRSNVSVTIKVSFYTDDESLNWHVDGSDTFTLTPQNPYISETCTVRYGIQGFFYVKVDFVITTDNKLVISYTPDAGINYEKAPLIVQAHNDNVRIKTDIVYATADSIPIVEEFYTSHQFYDGNKVSYENWSSAVSDNTQLRPYLDTTNTDESDTPIYTNPYYLSNYFHHKIKDVDALQLYTTIHNYKVEHAQLKLNNCNIPAGLLASHFPVGITYDIKNIAANPCVYLLYSVANRQLFDTSEYYHWLKEHNVCWQTIYQKYPGIFRESSYINDTATNSQELYEAAKRELTAACKPAFTYSLTGMDIYMYNSDFLPTRIKLGEQIRIDYQEKDEINDTLNAAIREPLYITGINHILRDDGSYQFTVMTRTATDVMVQRFAQLLNFGK